MTSSSEIAPVEMELKFLLDSAALLALRGHSAFLGKSRPRSLRSVYFDTARYDLREGGMSLRVRESDGHFVQTVKSRSGEGLFDRNEWESDVDDARPEPASLAHTQVKRLLHRSDQNHLSAVFATEIERTVAEVRRGGAVVEISLDEGQIVAGARSEPIRELELELKAGDPGALFELAKDLSGEAAIRLSFESKSERGYRLAGRDEAKALKAERTALTPDITAGEAFRRIVRSCLAQITGNVQRLTQVRSADALHQTRVGLRRLRAAFSAFEPVVDDDAFERMDAETHWLSDSLNAARDLDVFIRALAPSREDQPDEDPAMAAFRQRLFTRQAAAYDEAVAALMSSRYADLVLDVAAWAESGDWTRDAAHSEAREEKVGALARRSLTHLRKQVRWKGRHLQDLDAERRHKLRIKVKKLRYAADFFSESFDCVDGKRRHAFIDRLRSLQDCLGELNDIAVARRTAMAAVDDRAGESAFAGGLVVGRREAQVPALTAQAAEAFDRFAKARTFW
jgi:inorganic triphosphatase YgiF